MRSRGLVVAIAVVLAVAAAAAVVLYTQGVRDDATQGSNLEAVIVATQDIPANSSLDTLLGQDVFQQIRVPADALVDGAVTDVEQLRGTSTTAQIFANEQIPASRLSTGERPNVLGISPGHIAVSIELDAPQGGAGNIQPGDNVSVFATYQNVQTAQREVPVFTGTLIPDVRVLRIENPQVDTETGRQADSGNIRVTLDLLPKDAQDLVYAQENALVWLGLLPPGEDGPVNQPPSVVPIDLLRGAQLG